MGSPRYIPLKRESRFQLSEFSNDIRVVKNTHNFPSIVAVTGLDGHAWGSWRGKGQLGRMWLRDFLSKDLPNCRTMIYGYNSKLQSAGIHTIEGYCRSFLEELKKVRKSEDVSRPLSYINRRYI